MPFVAPLLATSQTFPSAILSFGQDSTATNTVNMRSPLPNSIVSDPDGIFVETLLETSNWCGVVFSDLGTQTYRFTLLENNYTSQSGLTQDIICGIWIASEDRPLNASIDQYVFKLWDLATNTFISSATSEFSYTYSSPGANRPLVTIGSTSGLSGGSYNGSCKIKVELVT